MTLNEIAKKTEQVISDLETLQKEVDEFGEGFFFYRRQIAKAKEQAEYALDEWKYRCSEFA